MIDVSAVRVPEHDDLLPGLGSTMPRAVIADPCQDETAVARLVRPAPRGAHETVARVAPCPPRTKGQGVWRQATRLATALARLLALAGLAVLVLLMR